METFTLLLFLLSPLLILLLLYSPVDVAWGGGDGRRRRRRRRRDTYARTRRTYEYRACVHACLQLAAKGFNSNFLLQGKRGKWEIVRVSAKSVFLQY